MYIYTLTIMVHEHAQLWFDLLRFEMLVSVYINSSQFHSINNFLLSFFFILSKF